jgi:hypothetical protein
LPADEVCVRLHAPTLFAVNAAVAVSVPPVIDELPPSGLRISVGKKFDV